MTTRLSPTLIGSWPERRLHPNEDPTFVQFEASHHCCAPEGEGHVDDHESSTPTTIQVAFRDDRPEGALDVEIRWTAFGKPQRLLLDRWAAASLASLLTSAHLGDNAGWKVER